MNQRKWRGCGVALVGVLALSALSCGEERSAATPPTVQPSVTAAQPYAGFQERAIRALADQQVADLLAGRGAGYALAAELNHYPGPAHVLELAADLGLSPEEEQAIAAIKASMQADAQRLGQQLVELERQLDQAFAGKTITVDALTRLTGLIATVEGQLRAVHLAAHLDTAQILSPEQIAHYDALRGYADTNQEHEGDHAHD